MTGGGRLFAVGPPRRRRGRARVGLDRTLVALREDDALEARLEGLVALSRILADQLDGAAADAEESRFTVARVAATYHATLGDLLAQTAGRRTDQVAALLATLLEDDDDAGPGDPGDDASAGPGGDTSVDTSVGPA